MVPPPGKSKPDRKLLGAPYHQSVQKMVILSYDVYASKYSYVHCLQNVRTFDFQYIGKLALAG